MPRLTLAGWRDLRLTRKLPAVIVAVAVTAGITVGSSIYYEASLAADRAVQARLNGVVDNRRVALETYLASIEQDVRLIADQPATLAALEAFSDGWNALGADAPAELQRLYIADNPHPVGDKQRLADAGDGSAYSTSHAALHPWFRDFQETRGYYDVFLFDRDGNLVYSVFKEADYATNLVRGRWRDSDLGAVFRRALAGNVDFTDFAPYAPSHDAPASFIAAPVRGHEGAVMGVLAFQMPIDGLNGLMRSAAGLGENGEAYIVGSDRLLRNDTRSAQATTILQAHTDSALVAETLATTGAEVRIGRDVSYRDVDVIAAVAPVRFLGTTWALVAELTTAEAQGPLVALRNLALATVGALLAVAAIVGTLMGKALAQPITRITDAMQAIAGGALQTQVPDRDRQDEVGAMASALEVFRHNALDARGLSIRLADRIETQLGARIDGVAGVAASFVEAASGVHDAATQTQAQASAGADAANQAAANAETVAAASSQLAASIHQIAARVEDTRSTASAASSESRRAQTSMGELSVSVSHIDDVVQLINEIARQTHLLALNATIESARAGEAGRGFAVVAGEVKRLSEQTAKATEEITGQIRAIQAASETTGRGLGELGQVIEQVNAFATAISATVAEQEAATRNIATSVTQASSGNERLSAMITHVAGAADASSRQADAIGDRATDLAAQARSLRDDLQGFLHELRAA